ncbi:hypothetical protein, conserved [Eimeria maxima]|uniref:Uncharacterized protein n=1 Tax=Eimeria maxima TaxID=5804 RepID=U6M712_EIMMA|nr:hypothetical protein, conserved [Eimeria maxima]CDJ58244.1 hypothetical protein, conserved [Eimeria maxima]
MFYVAERFFSVIWLLHDDNQKMSMLDLICNRVPTKRRQHSTSVQKQQPEHDEGEEEGASVSGASSGSSASSPKHSTATNSSYSSSRSGSVSLSSERRDDLEPEDAATGRKQVQQQREPLVSRPPPDPGLMPLMDLPPPATASCNSLAAAAAAAAAAADAAARAAALRHCRSAEGPMLSSGPSFLSASPCGSGARGKNYADTSFQNATENRPRPASAASAALGFVYFDEIGGFKGASSKLRAQPQQQRQTAQGPGFATQRRRVKRHTQPPLQIGMQPLPKLPQQALAHILPRDGLSQQQQAQQQLVSASHGIRCRSQGSLGRAPELPRQHWQLQLQGQLTPWQQQQQLQQGEQHQQQLQQQQQLRPHDAFHRKNSIPFSRSASLCDRSFGTAAPAAADACGLLSDSAAGPATPPACRHSAASRSFSRLDGDRELLRWSRNLGSSQHTSCCICSGSSCCNNCLSCCSSSNSKGLSFPRSISPGVYGRHRPSSYMQRRRYSTVCWPVDRAAAAARTAAAVGSQPHPLGCCRAAAASWRRQQHEEAAAAAAAAATKAAALAASDVLSLYRSTGASSSAAAAATATAAATAAASAVVESSKEGSSSSGAVGGPSISCQHYVPYNRSSSLHALQQQRQGAYSSRHFGEEANWRPFSSPSLSPCTARNSSLTTAKAGVASPLNSTALESGPTSCSSIRRCCCCSSGSSRNAGATSIPDICRGSPSLHQYR